MADDVPSDAAEREKGGAWLRGSGSVFTRCGCRDGHGGRRGISCPRLGQAGHGSWYFTVDLPRYCERERRRLRRGGYLTSEAAGAAPGRLAVPSGGGPVTVADWLEIWVRTRARVRPSTRRIYQSHVRVHLSGQFGGVLLGELTAWDVELVFRRLFEAGVTAHPPGSHRIRDTSGPVLAEITA
jgi:hypothetical protein